MDDILKVTSYRYANFQAGTTVMWSNAAALFFIGEDEDDVDKEEGFSSATSSPVKLPLQQPRHQEQAAVRSHSQQQQVSFKNLFLNPTLYQVVCNQSAASYFEN